MRVLILTEEMVLALAGVNRAALKVEAPVVTAERLSELATLANGIVGGGLEEVAGMDGIAANSANSEIPRSEVGFVEGKVGLAAPLGEGVVADPGVEANESGPLRMVEPRRLADGRWILNADLLGDETAEAWRSILAEASVVELTPEALV